MRSPDRPGWIYLGVAFLLFLIWSNSFVAASFLLGGERQAARLDSVALSVARFAPIAPICWAYSLLLRRRESLRLLRRYPVRLPVAGLLSVPSYNLALYYGQQHGVPAPVAALTTALLPLVVLLLAALLLGEPLTARKGSAFLVALAGLAVIAQSGGEPGAVAGYGSLLAVTAMAPLSWGIYSILSKPAAGVAAPLDWTFLSIGIGSLPLLALLPWRGAAEIARLDPPGWGALLFLSLLCTLVGYAVWSWLLRHLPASSVGFFVFLNPPLTALSKLVLAGLFPATFLWRLSGLEALGGLLVLLGLAIALLPGAGPRVAD